VINRDSETFAGGANDVGAQSSCDLDDVIVCLVEVSGCPLCTIGSPAPPVLAACILFVCLGFPGVPIATALADIGCLNLAGCATSEVIDIASDLVDEYGDDIPNPSPF